ncbi:SOS response-associated peptidase family protein [Altererythrobacter arenosus]|uniref:Abasic site processing protein n=1 Tax=Altererythrobacter arenosus TaxID=3032592 RepID=A0ABY8FVW9_9SPHN|nr:SOS response-associated peptidase family protein [Altererythrobacter sp. CAU 1644]WFL77551.1 SOS response-associated peptidase family protein [Altererythrobacter sp. CAU 1644]
MCNLYRMTKGKDEVAKWFEAIEELGGANFGEEVYPGYPGAVVAEGRVRQMSWGFPLVMKGKQGQPLKPKPVNNTRTDKLDSFFWRYSFEERRCLIPVTAWAEAQGKKGSMTRTWLSLPDNELFACAGVWRTSDEWGDCYSMVMTDSGGAAAEVHSRMPVILSRADYTQWTDGTPDEARALCRAWGGELSIDRTDQPWAGGAAAQKTLL